MRTVNHLRCSPIDQSTSNSPLWHADEHQAALHPSTFSNASQWGKRTPEGGVRRALSASQEMFVDMEEPMLVPAGDRAVAIPVTHAFKKTSRS